MRLVDSRKFFGILGALMLFVTIVLRFYPVNAATVWLTKDQIIGNMKSLCETQSLIASYESIGKTVQGNDIWLFTIGTNDQAKMLVTGATHGYETPGSHCIYFFVQWLLGGSAEANSVISKLQVLVVPIVNYDKAGISGTRKNANGVDLNRNHIRGWSYNSDPTSDNYAGPYAGSEPETQVINALFTRESPDVYIDIHDYGGSEWTNGDFRYPGYGSSSYATACAALHDLYSQKVQALGKTGHEKITSGAFGASRDDGYNNGATITTLWEETQSWSTHPETINYDLIHNEKWQHLEAYALATTEIYGINPTPTPTPTPYSDTRQIQMSGAIAYAP
jgi:hypothetical protein